MAYKSEILEMCDQHGLIPTHRMLVYGRLVDHFAKNNELKKLDWHNICESVDKEISEEFKKYNKSVEGIM